MNTVASLPAGWYSAETIPSTLLPIDATRCVVGLALHAPDSVDGGPDIRQGYYDPAFGFMDANTGMRITPRSWSSPALPCNESEMPAYSVSPQGDGMILKDCFPMAADEIVAELRSRRRALAPPAPSAGVDEPFDAVDNAEYIEHCADKLEGFGHRVTAGALRVIAAEYRTLHQPAAPSVSPAVEGDTGELPDSIRVPLDELHADAAYLIGRVQADGSFGAAAIECIRQKIDAAKVAIRLATPEQPEVVITTDESGRCVAVTRQDAEGRIVNVLWEAEQGGVFPQMSLGDDPTFPTVERNHG